MDHVTICPAERIGRDFIPSRFLPKGKDEYYLRNRQNPQPPGKWRTLRSGEIDELVKNGNTCDDWGRLQVSKDFEPGLVRTTEFFGLVRIGRLRRVMLSHHDLTMPAGITNCRIVSCDIGDDVALHNVRYLAHYIIGDCCMLLNIDEMHTTNHAKFGNGIIKDGEREEVRVTLELMNETGGRNIAPFDDMVPADAYLWAKYRDRGRLRKNLLNITQSGFDSRRGYYGMVGEHCVIKNSRIIKDVKFGSFCYAKGANKLKNLTVKSNKDEPTQIGEGVEMVNGIVGLGCKVFYGCKAVRFILGNNSNLKYGARLLNSFLGPNSTVSCCEMLNNLIFPAHEQHHNNSFLIASLVKGQSNLAAGATVGSNHNSRANDGEIEAGRGFWPGLCTSVKHSCRFASFTLLAKGDYPAEMDIPLPFSLVNNDVTRGRLEVMPAYWWMYNMYALARNTWKFQTRDKRKTKAQHVEFDSLAPDTVEEILKALELIAQWTARAFVDATGKGVNRRSEADMAALGVRLLTESPGKVDELEVPGERMEKSSRKVVVLKVREGYEAYRRMAHYYAVKNLLEYFTDNPRASFASMCRALKGPRVTQWVNLGGQLVPADDVESLIADIESGSLNTWNKIHRRYDRLWNAYPSAKQRHAFAVLCCLYDTSSPSREQWRSALAEAAKIQELIAERVYTSRSKDYESFFRRNTYSNAAEMKAVAGTPETNSFVARVKEETAAFKALVRKVKRRTCA